MPLDHLESYSPPHGFLPLGHIDCATTAFADQLQEFVAANAVVRLFAGNGLNPIARDRDLAKQRGFDPLNCLHLRSYG